MKEIMEKFPLGDGHESAFIPLVIVGTLLVAAIFSLVLRAPKK